MKKVLLAFDGSNFSEGAFEFARQLNIIKPILVTGVFMPQVDYANLWSYSTAGGPASGTAIVPMIEDSDAEIVNTHIKHFEELCQANGIRYRVHKDFYDFALPELKRESRFADLMIISGELFYKGLIRGDQYEFLKDALHTSECPVLIVPENYTFPHNNILAYDGSEECVYAIKQYAYIFPEFKKNKTLLVYADEEEEIDIPARDHIVELATQHFDDLTLSKVQINSKKYFSKWMNEKKGSILVSGSFGRSGFSNLFRKSFVADTIRDHQVPVFIAHK